MNAPAFDVAPGSGADTVGAEEAVEEFPPEPPVSALAPVYAKSLTAEELAELRRKVAILFPQLDDPEFARRELAETELSEVTPLAVTVLPEGWMVATLEQRMRLANVLRSWIAKADDPSLERISDVLDELGRTSDSARVFVKATLREYEHRTAELAIRQFEKLGGAIEKQPIEFGFGGRAQRMGGDEEDFKRYAVIGRNWQGGDTGLKYLVRIPRLELIYHVKGAPVTPRALAELQGAIPGLQIQERGSAYLGVTSNQGETPLRLSIVKVGSPAAKAGLKEDDLVLRFGGKEAGTFDNLVRLIGERNPGDAVEVDILRDGKRQTLVVELGEWSK